MTLRIDVDMDRCQGYRQCCLAVPEIFKLGEGKVRFQATADDSLASALEAAAKSCPTRAITIDPATS